MKDKFKNLFIAPDQVSNNCIPIIQNESATHDNCIKKRYNSYTCFIPENLDLEELVITNPPTIPNFHLDYLVYMAGLLIEIPFANKDFEMDFVPINSRLVQARVRNYRKYLDYLIDSGIIEENVQYIVGSKSRGFRYTRMYQTSTIAYSLTKNTLIKSLSSFKEINYSSYEVDKYLPTNKRSRLDIEKRDLSYLTNWLNSKLTIDYAGALSCLKQLREEEILNPDIENPNQRFMYRQTALLKFHKGIFLPNEDATAGRLHSALTQIKGILRPYMRYDGKKLIAVDVVNSQPYLSIVLLNLEKLIQNNIIQLIQNINSKHNSESYSIMVVKKVEAASTTTSTKLYIDLVTSGNFYEEFGLMLKTNGILDDLLDKNLTRKKAKEATFSALFSPNNAIAYSEEVKIFQKAFPELYEVFKLIKSGRGHHNTLAILLQSFEANLILHKACKIITDKKSDVPILTLHDSIITTEGYENYIQSVMESVLTEAIGVPPILKIERWE